MANSSCNLDLPDGKHVVEVDYGYWSGTATIRLDGDVVIKSNQLMNMGFNRGVDLPLQIGDHHAVVSIRPMVRGGVFATGYSFEIAIDADHAPEAAPGQARYRTRTAPQLIELMTWASAGGAVIGLNQRGENPTAFLYLAAPVLCSLVTRRSGLSTRVMAALCLGIVVVGIVAVAWVGAIV
jgi:hypothetical protein